MSIVSFPCLRTRLWIGNAFSIMAFWGTKYVPKIDCVCIFMYIYRMYTFFVFDLYVMYVFYLHKASVSQLKFFGPPIDAWYWCSAHFCCMKAIKKFSTVEGANSWDRMINRSWCICYKKGTLKLLMAPCDLGPNDFIGFTEVKVCVFHETCENYVKESDFCIRSNPLSQWFTVWFGSLYLWAPCLEACFQATSFGEDDFQG